MDAYRRLARAAAAFLAVAVAGPLLAQSEDVFSFIPAGGKTLLTQVIASRPPADEIKGLLSGKRSRDDWQSYLAARSPTVAALKNFEDQELKTLADYLAFNMPLPSVPADLARADWNKVLPRDGRELVLDYCQGCHIITVVVTQDRTKEAWLGTMNKPSHIQIKLTRGEREALASYLVLNAGIPIDQVPEELRAGGASY